MIAGDEGLGAGQIAEEPQAIVEVFLGADVAAQKKQIGRMALQMLQEQPGGVVAEAIVFPVQIGRDGDAHDG